MRCPTLTDLPPPPPGRTGWPWTEESPQLPAVQADGRPWPCISIVTPSYNQGHFIEETIRSILLQGYPNLEYIVVDGLSTDDTIDVIRKYEAWIATAIVERDGGQSNALNKGFRSASGELWQWINSDDVLLPNALAKVARAYDMHGRRGLVAGNVVNFKGDQDVEIIKNKQLTAKLVMWEARGCFHQPGVWFEADKWRVLGGFSESLNYVFDCLFLAKYLDFWPNVNYIDENLVRFRLHKDSKTVADGDKFVEETKLVLEELSRGGASPSIQKYSQTILRRLALMRVVTDLRSEADRGQRSRGAVVYEIMLRWLFEWGGMEPRFVLGTLRRLLLPAAAGR